MPSYFIAKFHGKGVQERIMLTERKATQQSFVKHLVLLTPARGNISCALLSCHASSPLMAFQSSTAKLLLSLSPSFGFESHVSCLDASPAAAQEPRQTFFLTTFERTWETRQKVEKSNFAACQIKFVKFVDNKCEQGLCQVLPQRGRIKNFLLLIISF